MMLLLHLGLWICFPFPGSAYSVWRSRLHVVLLVITWISKHRKLTREGKTNPEFLVEVEQKHHLTSVRRTSPSSKVSGVAPAPTLSDVGKRWYLSGPVKDDRDAAKGDCDDVAKGSAF